MIMLNSGAASEVGASLSISSARKLSLTELKGRPSQNATLRHPAGHSQRICGAFVARLKMERCGCMESLRRSLLIQSPPATKSKTDRTKFAGENVRPLTDTRIHSSIAGGTQTPAVSRATVAMGLERQFLAANPSRTPAGRK